MTDSDYQLLDNTIELLKAKTFNGSSWVYTNDLEKLTAEIQKVITFLLQIDNTTSSDIAAIKTFRDEVSAAINYRDSLLLKRYLNEILACCENTINQEHSKPVFPSLTYRGNIKSLVKTFYVLHTRADSEKRPIIPNKLKEIEDFLVIGFNLDRGLVHGYLKKPSEFKNTDTLMDIEEYIKPND